MSKLNDLETQFTSAINQIAQELQSAVSGAEDSVASQFQPFADRLSALASDPAGSGQVPAASGSNTGTDSASASEGGSASSTDAGATAGDGSTGSTATA